MAKFVEGRFSVRNGVLEFLGGLDLSPPRLAELAQIANLVERGTISAEAGIERVTESSPETRTYWDSLSPKARRAMVAVLWATLQILASWVLADVTDDAATPQDVERIVRERAEHERSATADEVRRAVDEALRRRPVSTVKAPTRPGRNAPCPCGSGKKYKKCCGFAAPSAP